MSTAPSPAPDSAPSLLDRLESGAKAVVAKVGSFLGLTPALEAEVDAELHVIDAKVLAVESVVEVVHEGIVAVEKTLEGDAPKS